jgi:DNA-binding beta-propeller fold protein YncE
MQMMNDGASLIDADSFAEIGFIAAGVGAHGLAVSRDGTKVYFLNHGSRSIERSPPHRPGSVTVIDFATRSIVAQWPV